MWVVGLGAVEVGVVGLWEFRKVQYSSFQRGHCA